jgi:hypothetical protein
MAVERIGAAQVWLHSEDAALIAAEQDALGIIGETYGLEIDLIAIPVGRLADDFFRLRTGLAGAVLQKLRNYGFRVAIIGDIARWTEASGPLRDFVRESNAMGQVLFVSDRAALEARLARD